MGRIVERRSTEHLIPTDELPKPRHEPTIFGKTFGQRTASIAASLAIAVGVTGPLPTAPTHGTEQIKSPNPIHGWGNSCTPERLQMFLVDTFPGAGRAVTVFECKSKGDGTLRWYNNGNLYRDPRYTSK